MTLRTQRSGGIWVTSGSCRFGPVYQIGLTPEQSVRKAKDQVCEYIKKNSRDRLQQFRARFPNYPIGAKV